MDLSRERIQRNRSCNESGNEPGRQPPDPVIPIQYLQRNIPPTFQTPPVRSRSDNAGNDDQPYSLGEPNGNPRNSRQPGGHSIPVRLQKEAKGIARWWAPSKKKQKELNEPSFPSLSLYIYLLSISNLSVRPIELAKELKKKKSFSLLEFRADPSIPSFIRGGRNGRNQWEKKEEKLKRDRSFLSVLRILVFYFLF